VPVLRSIPRPATAEQGTRWAVGGAVLVALVLGHLEGGFAPSRWAPAAVVLLWAAALAWARRGGRTPARPVLVALGAYALLTAWTAASVLWADTPGRAIDAAGRTLLYGAVLALVLLPRWPRASLRRLLVVVGAGACLLAALTLVRVAGSDDPSAFIDGRLIAPTGYVNATAALWVIAFAPLVHLAAGGLRQPVARVAALVGAGLLLETALLSQSRGGMLALVAACAVLVALTPDRGAVLLALAAVGGAALVAAPVLLDVRGAPTVAVLGDRLDDAVGELARTLVALGIAGACWQLVLVLLPPGLRRRASDRRLGVAATGAVVLAGLVVAVLVVGNPVSWAADRAEEALDSSGYSGVAATGDRLTGSLGSNRGDMYRVALRTLRDHPVTGVGAEDFQPSYLRDRRSTEAPRYAHSFPLGVLSGLGVVGGLLALVAFGTPVVSALRARRGAAPATRAGAAAAAAGFVTWFAGSAWDWTWEFPAVTILGLVLLGAAARATDVDGAAPTAELRTIRERARRHGVAVQDEERTRPWVPRDARGRAAATAGVLAVLALTAGVAALGLASASLRRGTALASSDPAEAAVWFDRAARLNPLDGDALLNRSIIARRLGDRWAWRHDLERALDRAPQDWFAHLELGLADAVAGDRRGALVQLRRARALNPQQTAVGETIDVVRRGGTVDPEAVEARVVGALQEKLQPTGS
jgi:hypothetical protein